VSCHVYVLGVPSQESEQSCICVLGVSSQERHIHDSSLSWLDTPNTYIHDSSLSWLDTPNTYIHDSSFCWLYMLGYQARKGSGHVYVLGVSSQESELSCIYVKCVDRLRYITKYRRTLSLSPIRGSARIYTWSPLIQCLHK
jgi:hypothetical protein